MVEEIAEFPIKGHDKCPSCGCENRIGQTLINNLKEDGKLDKGAFEKGLMWSIPLMDMSKPIAMNPLDIIKPRIPILNIFFDVCTNIDCLQVYITGVDFTWQEIKLSPQIFPKAKMPLRGEPPFMGRG